MDRLLTAACTRASRFTISLIAIIALSSTALSSQQTSLSPLSSVFAGSGLLFTEDPLGHRITIVNSRGDEVAAISTPVGPLDTDRAGNLFVAPNQNYGDFVAVYAPPYTAKRTLIKLPGQLVLDVAVDHRSGNFAVVSTSAQPGGGRSRISFYKRGDIVPCNVLEQPSGISTFFASAAFDQEGKLFFAVGLPGGVATLAESAGQCAASNIQYYRLETAYRLI